MAISLPELGTVVHGMGLGVLFLLAFAGGLGGLWSLRAELVTVGGARERVTRLEVGLWIMAAVAWLTVITGTWLIFPAYRDPALTSSQSVLLAEPSRMLWHTFAMAWKEHVGWLAPMLATAVAFVVAYYRRRLAFDTRMRNAVIALFVLAFAAAGVAGLFGAFINKVAPIV